VTDFPTRPAHGISKGEIVRMTRMLAIEGAEHGIRVNAIGPGTVATRTRNPPRERRGDDPLHAGGEIVDGPPEEGPPVDRITRPIRPPHGVESRHGRTPILIK
jgi:NAD(P)-dependent dehydrogenase (short-subunit alcohol dehydrogenase family)